MVKFRLWANYLIFLWLSLKCFSFLEEPLYYTLHQVSMMGRSDTSLVWNQFLFSSHNSSPFCVEEITDRRRNKTVYTFLLKSCLKNTADIPKLCGNVTCLCRLILKVTKLSSFKLVWMTLQGTIWRPVDLDMVRTEITQGVKICCKLLILQWMERAVRE